LQDKSSLDLPIVPNHVNTVFWRGKIALVSTRHSVEVQAVTLLHQPQAVCCRHLSPVKDIKIFLQGTTIVSLYGVL